MGRAPCCDKANVKKGPWSPEEDARLKSYIEQHGTGGNWIALPQKIGLKRCGKSCRLRWLNYLRPNIKHGGFSEEEDRIICSLYISIGSRWSIIAAQLPGRTDNDIKNYWNTRLKKKLLGKQRKDQQHARRFSGPKHHEIKRPEGNNGLNCMQASGDCNQIPYWHEPPLVPAFSNQDQRVTDDHTSIRKFLVKLGGRFPADDMAMKVRSPFDVYDNNPINQPASSSSAPFNPFDGSSSSLGTQMLQGNSNSFQTELDEMLIYCNAMKLEGLDCLYGVGGNQVNDGNGTSSSDSMSWNIDMSPLAYPPLALNYEGMQQPCVLAETVHLQAQ